MDSLVERLREGCPTYVENQSNGRPGNVAAYIDEATAIMSEAADELTRLTAENARLTEANREKAMQCLATEGQAMELQAENARLRGLIEPTEANVERVARVILEAHLYDMNGPGVDNSDALENEWPDWCSEATAALNELDRI